MRGPTALIRAARTRACIVPILLSGIERPEFKTFDTSGFRAWQLLDVFLQVILRQAPLLVR